MANIPTYDARAGLPGQVFQPQQSMQEARRASDALIGMGAEVGRFGDELHRRDQLEKAQQAEAARRAAEKQAAADEAFRKAAEQESFDRAKLDYKLALTAYTADLDGRQDHDAFVPGFNDLAKARREEVMAKVPAHLHGRLAMALDEQTAASFDTTRTAARKRQIDGAKAGIDADLDAVKGAFLGASGADRVQLVEAGMARIAGLVEKGYITQEDGEKRRQSLRGDLAGMEVDEAGGRDPRGTLAALDQGAFPLLQGEARLKHAQKLQAQVAALDSRAALEQQRRQAEAERAERRRERELDKASSAADRELKSLDEMIGRGHMPAEADLARAAGYLQAAGRSGEIKDRFADLAETERMLRMAPQQAEAELVALQQKGVKGELTPAESRRVEKLQNIKDRNAREIAADPLSWYGRRDGLALPAIDWNDPASIQAGLSDRRDSADAIAKANGLAPSQVPPLEKPGQDALLARLEAAKPDEGAAQLGAVAQALGPQHAGRLFKAIAKQQPAYGLAGAFAARGRPQLAAEMLEGARLLKTDSGIGAKPVDVRNTVASHLGDSAALNPQFVADTSEAVAAIYAARATKAGTTGTVDTDLLAAVTQEVAGKVATVNGGSVLLPHDWDEDRLKTLLDRLTFEDVAGLHTMAGPLSPRDLRRKGRLYAVAPGRYRVAIGNGFAKTAEGEDAVFDIAAVERAQVVPMAQPAVATGTKPVRLRG